MSSLTPSVRVPVLTAHGRRRLEDRLARAAAELAALDERFRRGAAAEEDVPARLRLEGQIEDLRRLLDTAAAVADVDEDPAIVEVGDEVDVEGPDGEVDTYAIVHPAEADAAANRVSARSPLGRALLGARPGDLVTVEAPAGSYSSIVRARRRLA